MRYCVAVLTTLSGVCVLPSSSGAGTAESTPPAAVQSAIQQTCFNCHNDETSEGGLDLTRVTWSLESGNVRSRWIQIHDRIATGEMPPAGSDFPEEDRDALLAALAAAIHAADIADVVADGRGPMRRLTRREYEQNLRDLLRLPNLDIRDMLPADRERHNCNKVAEVLDVSRIQMEAYLTAAETALREAVASGVAPREVVHYRLPATRMFLAAETYGGREAMFFAKDSQMVPLTNADLSRLRNEKHARRGYGTGNFSGRRHGRTTRIRTRLSRPNRETTAFVSPLGPFGRCVISACGRHAIRHR